MCLTCSSVHLTLRRLTVLAVNGAVSFKKCFKFTNIGTYPCMDFCGPLLSSALLAALSHTGSLKYCVVTEAIYLQLCVF